MTIIGVGACTALLLTGFGIRDSVLEITGNQYQKIWTYDAQVYLNPQASVREKKSLNRKLSEMKEISGAQQVYEKGVQVGKEGHFYDAALVVPENPDRLDAYIHLHDRVTGKKHRLKDHSAVLSEKAAAQLHVPQPRRVLRGDGVVAAPERLQFCRRHLPQRRQQALRLRQKDGQRLGGEDVRIAVHPFGR